MNIEVISFKSRLIRRLRTQLASLLLLMAMVLSGLTYGVVAATSPYIDHQTSQEIRTIVIPEPVHTEESASQPAIQEQTAPVVPAPAYSPPAPTATPVPVHDRISIASLGLSSQYVSVGTTATNNIDVHPTLAGWWNKSAQFGSPGAAFLDGHNPGVFSSLPGISVGAQITITKASGEIFNYTVVHTETVQLAGIDMRRALSTWNGAPEGLNLMTCVGPYNPSIGTTDQRFVVYAIRS